LALAFAAGTILVGGISQAAPSVTPGTKACVSTSTNAIYAAKNGACTSNQKLISLSGDSIDVSAIANLAGPSVVSIEEKVTNGTGTRFRLDLQNK
jgi:hypothetical protein